MSADNFDAPNNIEEAQRNLIKAYKKALHRSGQLDRLNRMSVEHTVAVSSSKAARRLRIASDAPEASVKETSEFAQEIAKEDKVSGVLSLGVKHGLDVLLSVGTIWIVLLVVIAILLNVGGSIVGGLGIVGLLFVGWQMLKLFDEILAASWGSTDEAKKIVADIVKPPEAELFKLTGSAPPNHLFLKMLAPIATIPVAFVGLVIILGVLRGVIRIISGSAA
jgi:hypothetical protein